MPAEEAREDASAKDILFHVYEYKVPIGVDKKERRRLKLVQKRTKICEFHCLYYLPANGRRQYHMTSYMLAGQCRRERQAIEWGDISLHYDYSKRMALSFNKELQSRYYQIAVSASRGHCWSRLMQAGSNTHVILDTGWSMKQNATGRTMKQNAAATMRNMQAELCIGDTTNLVKDLSCNRTV